MMKQKMAVVICLILGLGVEGANAQSHSSNKRPGWEICNKSSDGKIYVAYSLFEEGEWVTRGWRNIEMGDCSVIQSEYTNRYAYYYAENESGRDWGGDINFCVHPTKKFEYEGSMGTCWDDYETVPFYQFDLGERQDGLKTQNLVD